MVLRGSSDFGKHCKLAWRFPGELFHVVLLGYFGKLLVDFDGYSGGRVYSVFVFAALGVWRIGDDFVCCGIDEFGFVALEMGVLVLEATCCAEGVIYWKVCSGVR